MQNVTPITKAVADAMAQDAMTTDGAPEAPSAYHMPQPAPLWHKDSFSDYWQRFARDLFSHRK